HLSHSPVTEFHAIAQVGVELVGSIDSPTSMSQRAGTTGVPTRLGPEILEYLQRCSRLGT
uniref:Uncharacterized protein n=1 Tax=Marmota marmota marmota TaxID=9994 RepID=A0A8C6EVM1_MARMA